MAYIVKDSNGNDITNEFRAKLYSGSSNFKVKLNLHGTMVPSSQISKITISSPIINKNDKVFTLGSFITQQVTIKFKNLDNLDIVSGKELYLEIGQYIDSIQDYVYVPIGYYVIDDLDSNYQKTCEITCLDRSIILKKPIDYSPCFDENGKATIDTILQYICSSTRTPLGDYPTTNGDIETSMYDSSISAKQWISYIAELKGCNAKIDRNGKLILKEIKSGSNVSINALKSKSWNLGEKYKISKVTYFDAKREFSAGENTNNTLVIRQDNPFIKDQTTIDNIYEIVKDFEVYSLTTENYGDFTLDCWDTITYSLGKDENGDLIVYNTLNDNTLTYEITIMSKVDIKIPTYAQEVTTNTKDNPIAERRVVKTQVDLLEGTVETLTAKTSELDTTIDQNQQQIMGMLGDYALKDDIVILENNVKTLQTDTYKKTEVNKILKGQFYDEEGNKVVSEIVQTTSGTFDENGMLYEKTNAPTNTRINEIGMSVKNSANNTELLFAGYDENTKQTVVRSDNMEVKNFFVLQGRSRLEDYESGTGVFWVGN